MDCTAREPGHGQPRTAEEHAREVACVTFGTVGFFTVLAPLTPLMVLAGASIAGSPGGWAVFGALVACTPMAYLITWFRYRNAYAWCEYHRMGHRKP